MITHDTEKLSSEAAVPPEASYEDLPSRGKLIRFRILNNKMLMVGGVIVLIFLLMAFLAPYLTRYDPYKRDIRNRFTGPSGVHLMGTDQIGREKQIKLYRASLGLS